MTVYRLRITKYMFTCYMLYVTRYIQIARYVFTNYTLHVTCYGLQGTPLQITKDTRFSLQSPDFIGWWQYYIEVKIVMPPPPKKKSFSEWAPFLCSYISDMC